MSNGSLYKVELLGLAGNKAAVNVFHYEQVSVDVGTADEAGVALAVKNEVWDAMKPHLSNFYQLQSIRVTDLQTLQASYELAVNENGSNATQAGPNQSAVILSWKTALRGPSYRGRNFIAGVPEANVTGSVLIPAALTAWQGVADAIIDIGDDVATPLYHLNVYSRKTTNTTPVTVGIARSVTGTIRNRRPTS